MQTCISVARGQASGEALCSVFRSVGNKRATIPVCVWSIGELLEAGWAFGCLGHIDNRGHPRQKASAYTIHGIHHTQWLLH